MRPHVDEATHEFIAYDERTRVRPAPRVVLTLLRVEPTPARRAENTNDPTCEAWRSVARLAAPCMLRCARRDGHHRFGGVGRALKALEMISPVEVALLSRKSIGLGRWSHVAPVLYCRCDGSTGSTSDKTQDCAEGMSGVSLLMCLLTAEARDTSRNAARTVS